MYLCVLCNILVLGPALFTNSLHVGSRHFNAFFALTGNYLMDHLSVVALSPFFEQCSPLWVTLIDPLPSPSRPHRPRPSAGSFLYLCLKIAKLKMHEWVVTFKSGCHFFWCCTASLSAFAKRWAWREVWILVHCSQCVRRMGGEGGGWVRERARWTQGGEGGRTGASTIKAGRERKSRCCTIGSSVLLLLQGFHLQLVNI